MSYVHWLLFLTHMCSNELIVVGNRQSSDVGLLAADLTTASGNAYDGLKVPLRHTKSILDNYFGGRRETGQDKRTRKFCIVLKLTSVLLSIRHAKLFG
ncbi:hypothetical protein evm_012206 [Chilo suppressalis]|nr:hypothetical protein evm_012206 [Chilo suppressalis]